MTEADGSGAQRPDGSRAGVRGTGPHGGSGAHDGAADLAGLAGLAGGWTRGVGPALAGLAVSLAALVHHGMGPELGDAWYHPRGFLRGPVSGLGLSGPVATALGLALPMLALTGAVFLTTRSALARTAALAATFATALYGYYAQRLTIVWEIYEAHWSATLTLFALVVAGALGSVGLARSWRRLPLWGRAATYLPVFAFVLAFERNVTGTDPAMRFALSPWPLVQIFALEALATGVASLLLGVGLGLLAARALRRRLGPAAVAVGAASAVLVPVASMALGPPLGLLAFEAPPRLLALLGIVSLVVMALALWIAVLPDADVAARPAGGAPTSGELRLAVRGRLFTTAALLLGAPLLIGQVLTRLDYAETRNVRARHIVDALDAYFARHGEYPAELGELVDAGHLERIPEPRIGFPGLPQQDGFRYDSFGTSYMLEFAAPRWIQCAYNPPWQDDLAEDDPTSNGAADEETELAGSWSCPSTPPELW